MVRLKGPLLSQSASKQLGKTLIYKTKNQKGFLTRYNKPGGNRKFTPSASQEEKRDKYGACVAKWQALTDEQKQVYKDQAKNKPYSGWNLYLKACMAIPAEWPNGYSYRKKITITGQAGSGTDYQVKLLIGSESGKGDFHLENHCQDFPQDIRFTDDDGETELKYWIKDTEADAIEAWVKVTDDLGTNKDIYVYYGKAEDSTTSNIVDAFILGDNFESYADTAAMEQVWIPTTGNRGWLETTIAKQGNKSLCVGNNGAGEFYLRSFSHSGDRAIEFAGYVLLAGDKMNFIIDDVSAKIAAYINNGYPAGGYWGYLDGSGWNDSGLAFSPTTWYDLKIVIDMTNHTWSAYANGDTICEDVSFNNVASAANRIKPGVYVSYYDIFRVRKYISPEPAWSSAGNEETP